MKARRRQYENWFPDAEMDAIRVDNVSGFGHVVGLYDVIGFGDVKSHRPFKVV